MNRKNLSRAVLPPVFAALLVTACSTVDKVAPGRSKVDYKKSKVTESLEVPPDLSSNTINDAPASLDSATYSEYGSGSADSRSSAVLPAQTSMRVERDGDQQWLVVRGTPAQVWPRVKEFWLQEGFLIRMEDPRVGILETGWSENRADIPQGPIRNLLGKVIDSVYSSATRDQYRVRLENGAQPDTTEIYLTHRGMQEVIKGGAVDSTPVWEPRATDPELEAEMLKRLMVYMGVEEEKAQVMLAQQTDKKDRAQLVSDTSGTMLIIYEDFSRAWRRTGVALDRVGFAVEDRNRSDGTYYVRYSDPLAGEEKGMLSKLAFWSSDDQAAAKQYHIKLVASGATTRVIVDDAEGARDTT
ncbi:MAG TPA: outer membrane protein assembly factor BamC, partial [Gammaproteobacteria bacterium]|nr:outer membrane protein assembly factor BamC [Gammaproteobacteria bacterium]